MRKVKGTGAIARSLIQWTHLWCLKGASFNETPDYSNFLLTIAGILCGIGFLSMKKQVDTLTQLFHEALKPHKQRMKNGSILAQKSYKKHGKKAMSFFLC